MLKVRRHRCLGKCTKLGSTADTLSDDQEGIDDVARSAANERIERPRKSSNERSAPHRRTVALKSVQQDSSDDKPSIVNSLCFAGIPVVIREVSIDQMEKRPQTPERKSRMIKPGCIPGVFGQRFVLPREDPRTDSLAEWLDLALGGSNCIRPSAQRQ
jgi:hypothetical protein